MGTLTEKVFLSYADEDGKTAHRVHEDLRRSQKLEVWAYQESREYGVDFRQEFEAQIRRSNYFVLLDSPSARRSEWILTECKLATECKVKRFVCALVNWEKSESWRQMELFPDQNFTTAIDLTNYDAGIRELCRVLQANYYPWSIFPRDHDFDGEVRKSSLDKDRTQELIDLYREFREHFADPEFAEALLRVVIKKCQVYGATKVISASLALGVMLADASRHQDALRTFCDLTKQHAPDPRPWAALGSALFHLGRYQESLQALTRSRNCILEYYKEESATHVPEIVHNIANVLVLLGRHHEAETEINGLSAEQQTLPFIRGLKGRLLVYKGRYREALPHLQKAYEEGVELLPAVVIDLADCYMHLRLGHNEFNLMQKAVKQLPASPEVWHRAANCFLMRKDSAAAISALRNAVQCAKDIPQYRAQLAALLCRVGQVEEGLAEARKCTKFSALTAHDRYYRGLAYYVLAKKNIAEDELSESRKDPVVSTWPHYSRVLD